MMPPDPRKEERMYGKKKPKKLNNPPRRK